MRMETRLKQTQHAHLARRGRRFAFPLVWIAILVLLLMATPAAAQPTGYQEYYVLGYEEQVWRTFLGIYDGPDQRIPGRICSTVSLVATADYQVIYYDHWEDGYEVDLLHPVQSTTEIHGDGDPSNGGTGDDILFAGDDINLTSDQNITGRQALNGYVPVNPRRDPAYLRYDGGDHIISSGGPVDLTHAMWPLYRSWVGSAWEVYSRQAYADTYFYRLPVGEDLYDFGGGDTGIYGDFRNVYLQLGAFEDNTTVSIDNGTDLVNLTLDRGQTYSSMGYVNSTSAPPITINTGTTIRSSRPTQVGLITGADSSEDEGFQGRSLMVLPGELWGADYVVPVPSGGSGDDTEIYLFNPNDFPITVHASDREAETTFIISPAGSLSATVPYSQQRGGHGPVDSAARFTSSDGTFSVIVCVDTSDVTYAWGYSVIPSKYLTRDYYVSWAPGSENIPPTENGSPVWVAPVADRTTFYVDYGPLDGVVDETFTLDILQQRRIFDPDNDNTGMHVWATGEFAMVWGEDPRTAGPSDPYLDMGITTLPLLQRWLDPVLTLDKLAEPAILPRAGGTVTFTLVAQAYHAPLVNVDITDTLPLRWTYVPGSTRVTYSDNSTENPEPAARGQALLWDLSANLGFNQGLTLTFQANITNTDGITSSVNQGEAVGTYEYADVLFNPSDEATVYISPLRITKSVNTAQAEIGEPLVYTLSYANLSTLLTVTNARLHDAVPIQYLALQSASGGGAYNSTSGNITWALGTLLPGASGTVTFAVKINSSVEDDTVIENVAYMTSEQAPQTGSNVVRTTVLAPDVEFTKLAPTVAGPGQVITYTLSYANAGRAPATGVRLEDVIPVAATYSLESLAIHTGSRWVALTDAADGDPGAYISPTLVITPGIIPGTIAPGEGGQIRFSVRLASDLPPGSLVHNWATLDQDLAIPHESNLAVTRISDLLISKAAQQAVAPPGGVISYTLTYENVSRTSPQTQVYVREPIPAYTSLVPGTVYGGDQVEYSCDHGATWSATLPITPVTHIRWYDAYVAPSTPVTPTTASVGFAVQVTTTLPSDARIQNIAHVTSTQTAAYLHEWVPSNQVEVATTGLYVATIHGTVFRDSDGDGLKDPGETGISRVLITLTFPMTFPKAGSFREGALAAITATTDLDGNYTFYTNVAGVHTVIETDPAAYTPGLFEPVPLAVADLPSYFSTTPNEVHVNVTLGNDYRVDFGDALTNVGFASIYGTVFQDTDGDGKRDADESGIPGVPVTLDGATTVTTDPYGNYTFSTTVPGIHAVFETDSDGYFSTTPNEVQVEALLGHGYPVEFGDAPTRSGFASIYGTVFEDTDADRIRDADELGIPRVLITLDGTVTTTTNLYGHYTFSTPSPGLHMVVETDPADYVPTTPNEVRITVTPGRAYRLDFGDVSPAVHACDPDIYEEDDTTARAATFVVNTTQAHQFCDDATDWVRFTARANTVYTITTASWGRRADTFLALFDTDSRSLLVANDDYGGATDYSSRIVWQPGASGVYYVRTTNRGGLIGYHTDYDLTILDGRPVAAAVIYLPIVAQAHGSATGGYRVVLDPSGIISHTCPDDYETDDTWGQAGAIAPGTVQVHSFDSDPTQHIADKDLLWFDAPASMAVLFAITPVSGTQTLMEITDERGIVLTPTGTTHLLWRPPASGRYYLSVSPQAGSTSFGCADTVGYSLLMDIAEMNALYLPVVTCQAQ